MTITYKVLGMMNTTTNTTATLYTVPAATSTIISTLNVCSQSTSTSTFRIAVRPAGVTLAPQHYIAYETPLPANDSISITIGITLAATDVISVYANTSTTSFAAFGSEIT